MALFLSVLRNEYFITILAVMIPIVFFASRSNYETVPIHPDARASLQRAQTQECKNEIYRLAHDLSVTKNKIRLVRTCAHDSKSPKTYATGCVTNSSLGLTVKLELPSVVPSLTLCLEVCFSYSHSYGGLNKSSNRCYCGDSDIGHNENCQEIVNNSNGFSWYRLNEGIYTPLSLKNSSKDRKADPISIAFLLTLNGRSSMQVRRLLRAIYRTNHQYYIHVDKRQDYLYNELLPLQKDLDNIIVTKSRFSTIWGGPSLLQMILDAMSRISTRQWDYLINLSESDFPIKPLNELELFLQSNNRDIFLKTHNMRGYNFIKKQGLDRTFYQCDDHVWRLGERVLPLGIVYSGGSDWFALPRDFCSYVISELKGRGGQPNIVRSLVDIFNHTLLPVETFFHTIALNSDFCDRFRDENLRLTNWQRKQGCKCQHKDVVDWCGCSPIVYRSSDWDKLKKTSHSESLFFSRKFDPSICNSIINQVEGMLLKASTEAQRNDSRYWLNIYDSRRKPHESGNNALLELGSMALKDFGLHPWADGRLESVNLYFNQDRFVGYVYQYCEKVTCMQLLLVRDTKSHLKYYDDDCLGSGERKIQAVEVNHGFDVSERIFRDYYPLHERSNLVVFHEWLVQRAPRSRQNTTSIELSWRSPSGKVELVQDVILKLPTKSTRLSLAHRLTVERSLDTGLWALDINVGHRTCLTYEFLIVGNPELFEDRHFTKFYKVLDYCENSSDGSGQAVTGCSLDWTLHAKEEILSAYKLS